jgi:hypothetical protein
LADEVLVEVYLVVFILLSTLTPLASSGPVGCVDDERGTQVVSEAKPKSEAAMQAH